MRPRAPTLIRCGCAPILAYCLYLLALGSFWAIDGRFGVFSEPVRAAIWWPATPLFDVPVVIPLFEGYLKCWYVDPSAAETTR
jgi:hypothetical protein